MTAQIDSSACAQPFWLPGGHSQTLYGALAARYHRISFVRDRVDTPDGDFIDFDWAGPGLYSDKTTGDTPPDFDPRLTTTAARRWAQASDWDNLANTPDTRALLLFHGLEGSSKSRYAQAIAQYFRARGWIIVVAHFRGCSGFMNRMARAYYSGDSDDIHFMIRTALARAPHATWHTAGVSMGGNAMIKYLGERPEVATRLAACAAISAPLDLAASGNCLSDTFAGRHVYARYFLHSMKHKLYEKAKRFPGAIDTYKLSRVHTLRDFDDMYTAPMHGYKNALDYWTRASGKPWLKDIALPALVLNARNDPFIPQPSLPSATDCSDHVLLHQPAEGGHVGFVTGHFPANINWLPARLARYFEAHV